MAVTRGDVAHIADLARLAIDEDRMDELVEELNGILIHVDALRQVDTEGVMGTAGVGGLDASLRADEGPQIPLDRPRSAFAPAMRDDFFVVPRLSTHEDAIDEVVE
jgi:aspartyl-tRNA(Asn)/glutamyl-tRNA(Gln) amidotransferase subunit C